MTDIDVDGLNAKVETERARLVALLRALAARLEALPLEKLTEPSTFLAASVDTLARWATREREGAAPAPGAGSAERGGTERRLRELNALRDQGLVTPEEYETKRREILRDL